MMECKYCGATLAEDEEVCPECGKPVHKETNAPSGKTESFSLKLPENPTLAAGFLLSAISFALGIVLLAIALARYTNLGLDMLVFLPAFAGLVLDVYAFYRARAKRNSFEKLLSLIAFGLAGFTIFFGFLTCCILGTM